LALGPQYHESENVTNALQDGQAGNAGSSRVMARLTSYLPKFEASGGASSAVVIPANWRLTFANSLPAIEPVASGSPHGPAVSS